MANLNKPRFAVSVTPAVVVAEVDNEAGAHTVMHEAVGRTLSGSGTYTGVDVTANTTGGSGTYGWDEGVNTAISSDGVTVTMDSDTGVVFIKHTGLLFGTSTASAAADTVKVLIDVDQSDNLSGTSTVLSELKAGEAIIFVRPGDHADLVLNTGASGNHVGVEVACIDT